MNRRPFQFTLRRLLMSMVYLSAAFAIVAALIRMWQGPWGEASIFEAVLLVVGPFAICTLIGAGIGELNGSATEGALHGIAVPSFLTLVVLALIFALLLILSVFSLFI